MTLVENNGPGTDLLLGSLDQMAIEHCLVIGITGPPGAGKSTLTSALIQLLRKQEKKVGIIAVDPSSPLSGGAILGDRVRMMDHALDPGVIVRSMASRGRLGGLCASAGAVARIMGSCGCDVILIETVGVGQSEIDIVRLADLTLMVLAPGFGDDIQAMKAGLLEVADCICVNKSDLAGAEALCLEMEQLFRGRDDGIGRVISTRGHDGTGVAELLDLLLTLSSVLRQSGKLARRRNRSLERETLDWALELLRPHLLEKIERGDDQQDPRLRAERLTNEWRQ